MPDGVTTSEFRGTLELIPRGGGFLRDQAANYRAKPSDPFVPEKLARSLGLRGGESLVVEKIPPGRQSGATMEAKHIRAINDGPVEQHKIVKPFEELTAIDPQARVQFEIKGGSISMRVVDLM